MNTVNETGRRKGRYIFTVFETGQSGVQRHDRRERRTETIWQSPAPLGHVAFDACYWTPWGTLITAEESWETAPLGSTSAYGRQFELKNPLHAAGILEPLTEDSASTASKIFVQKKTVEPDLAALAGGKGLTVFNRSVTAVSDEFDVKGKDVQQQSFVGVAFHGVDGTTYDAIYFRPFNFTADDPARRVRAVQYIAHPTHTWQKLRTEQPGKYEEAVNPVPDPNGWFHARVAVASPKVSVFVGDAKEPSLVVTQLSDRKKGLVGPWVGNNSAGDFANFKIVPA